MKGHIQKTKGTPKDALGSEPGTLPEGPASLGDKGSTNRPTSK